MKTCSNCKCHVRGVLCKNLKQCIKENIQIWNKLSKTEKEKTNFYPHNNVIMLKAYKRGD